MSSFQNRIERAYAEGCYRLRPFVKRHNQIMATLLRGEGMIKFLLSSNLLPRLPCAKLTWKPKRKGSFDKVQVCTDQPPRVRAGCRRINSGSVEANKRFLFLYLCFLLPAKMNILGLDYLYKLMFI